MIFCRLQKIPCLLPGVDEIVYFRLPTSKEIYADPKPLPGYFIAKKGDTVRCTISYGDWNRNPSTIEVAVVKIGLSLAYDTYHGTGNKTDSIVDKADLNNWKETIYTENLSIKNGRHKLELFYYYPMDASDDQGKFFKIGMVGAHYFFTIFK